MTLSICKDCGQEVKWVRSQRNKMVPIDPIAVCEDAIRRGPVAIQAPKATMNATVVSSPSALAMLAPDYYYIFPLHQCQNPTPMQAEDPMVMAGASR